MPNRKGKICNREGSFQKLLLARIHVRKLHICYNTNRVQVRVAKKIIRYCQRAKNISISLNKKLKSNQKSLEYSNKSSKIMIKLKTSLLLFHRMRNKKLNKKDSSTQLHKLRSLLSVLSKQK